MFNPTNKPLIVQSDSTVLLDVHDPGAEEARRSLSQFAELEKSPEHIHTYRITNLSLWNAAAAGFSPEELLGSLQDFSRFPLPDSLGISMKETMNRFGALQLFPTSEDKVLYLGTRQKAIYAELEAHPRLKKLLIPYDPQSARGIQTEPAVPPLGFLVQLLHRGTIKQQLINLGYPVEDMAPLREGSPLDITLQDRTPNGQPFEIRDYQTQSVQAFLGEKRPGTGFGTIVLPCGAGKTIVGLAAMAELGQETLILTTNSSAVHQWIRELREKTTLEEDQIGEYTGSKKQIRPVTVATYQILVWRPDKESDFPHFDLLRSRNWGLVIYDEVHLLPAPMFRVTAELQALRRLGLTATLVREDGLEREVFSLVGPKRFDIPWKDLEGRGWIAQAFCVEYRCDLPEARKIPYATADRRQKYRIASENPIKYDIAEYLIAKHRGESILVIGQYLDQLRTISKELGAPLLTGETPQTERDVLYSKFREGSIKVLVVSKVANFAIDLPDASVAIQISGSFGSRQEEAQRLGRILRPKKQHSFFYTIISRNTSEEEFSLNRQKFLTEQGYRYSIEIWDGDPRTDPAPHTRSSGEKTEA
ncbi:DNA repair helicase XPB [Spirochaeta lutea]|uniref:DNA repair helicase XPB n=1 Tax=Spirochaeta lutea TaxID=1480694 RepID=UPI00055FB0C3|nr:DNA repair helicase XPB [Spirochaeta lutea]